MLTVFLPVKMAVSCGSAKSLHVGIYFAMYLCYNLRNWGLGVEHNPL